jgi:hypothetical protein
VERPRRRARRRRPHRHPAARPCSSSAARAAASLTCTSPGRRSPPRSARAPAARATCCTRSTPRPRLTGQHGTERHGQRERGERRHWNAPDDGDVFLWLQERRATDRAATRSQPSFPPITLGAAGAAGAGSPTAAGTGDELTTLAGTQQGGRNDALNVAAYNLGQLVAGGELLDGRRSRRTDPHRLGHRAGGPGRSPPPSRPGSMTAPAAAHRPSQAAGRHGKALAARRGAAGRVRAVRPSAGWQPVDLAPFLGRQLTGRPSRHCWPAPTAGS